MPKVNRGKALWKVPARGRGTCPICLATRIKLLYTRTTSHGEQMKVCKRCSAAASHKVDEAYLSNQPLPFRRKHKKLLPHVRR